MFKLSQKLLAFTLLACLSLAVSGCLKSSQADTKQTVNANQNTNTSTEEIDTSNWKMYRNEEYGLEFKCPGDWVKNGTGKERISFYSQDWLTEKDPFTKELIWPELNVYYYDNFNNEDELIKTIFNLNNYSTITDAVEKEIDLVKYGQYNLDAKSIYRLEVSGEMSMTYYFLSSNVKKMSFIVLAFPYYNKELERLILSTIQF